MCKHFRNGAGCDWLNLLLLQLCKCLVKAKLTEVSVRVVLEKQPEWTFILIQLSNKNIPCQQLSIRRAGNSHPPAGFIQRLDSFSLRLDWHLLASIMGLKEGLEQRGQETEKRESLHNQKTVKDVTW